MTNKQRVARLEKRRAVMVKKFQELKKAEKAFWDEYESQIKAIKKERGIERKRFYSVRGCSIDRNGLPIVPKNMDDQIEFDHFERMHYRRKRREQAG